MNPEILKIVETFSDTNILPERKEVLQPLIDYIQNKIDAKELIRLNFICTHNSRRSHLSQIWTQALASYFEVKNIVCYSGGTEATAMFPKVVQALIKQGFCVYKLSEEANPIYAVKFDANEAPIICFSKKYDTDFNPKNAFGAIMTCDNADQGCPMVIGAEGRFPIKYEDPKAFDGTVQMDEKYAERSLEIGQEMWYILRQIKK